MNESKLSIGAPNLEQLANKSICQNRLPLIFVNTPDIVILEHYLDCHHVSIVDYNECG